MLELLELEDVSLATVELLELDDVSDAMVELLELDSVLSLLAVLLLELLRLDELDRLELLELDALDVDRPSVELELDCVESLELEDEALLELSRSRPVTGPNFLCFCGVVK